MKAKSLIDVVETSYRMELDLDRWQLALTEMMSERWGRGVYSFRFDATDPDRFCADGHVGVGVSAGLIDGARDFHRVLPADKVRTIFHGGPIVTSLNAVLQMEESVVQLSERYEMSYDWPESKFDQLGIRTLDANRRGLTFAMPFDGRFPLSTVDQVQWTRIAVHIASAYRLRVALDPTSEATGEAVLDLEGRCQHATGEARASESRDLLRDAARTVMRARGRDQRHDADEALSIWHGLVSGRWSLVDRFDSDGKHLLVAHKNAPEVRDPRAFSIREGEVASYLAMGHSNKLIGYTLGLKTSTVATHIHSIQRKLGASSRVEAVRILAAVQHSDD